MKPAAIYLLLLVLIGWLGNGLAEPPVHRIGVLAKRGAEMTLQRWNPTADYLNERLVGHRFEILPLPFDDVASAIQQGRIDFVLTNPAQYVQLAQTVGISRVATLKNRTADGYLTRFGGVIFSRNDNRRIQHVGDLNGQRFGAVDPISLGGYLMAQRELRHRSVDIENDAELVFLGTHDAVVQAVLAGDVDAGTVRTDTLERMASEGSLDLQRLFIFPPVNDHPSGFPYLHSTPLYPEWPLAAARHTPRELVEQVSRTLIGMAPDSEAAVASVSHGWTVPANYRAVRELLRELGLPPFKRITERDYGKSDGLPPHWLAIALLLAISGVAYYTFALNRRLEYSHRETSLALGREAETRLELESKQLHLDEIEAKFASVAEATLDGIVLLNERGEVAYWNPAAETIFGCATNELAERRLHDLFVPEELRDAANDGFAAFQHHGQGSVVGRVQELTALRMNGSRFPIELSVSSLIIHGRWHAVGVLRDISDRRALENHLKETQANFSNVVGKNRTGILIIDDAGKVRFSNPAAETSLGRETQELNGAFFGVPTIGAVSEMEILQPGGNVGTAEVTASETEWEGNDAYLVMLHDVTDRKKAEEHARYIAFHDSLTGLPNRALFLDRLGHALARARRSGQALGLLFMDLDRFKSVNDTLGHSVGDELLRGFSRRLSENFRESDTIARLGGDEFIVLLEHLASADHALSTAEKLASACEQPLMVLDHELYARPSIGIAVYPDHGTEPETLVRQADAAMYNAKHQPGQRISFFASGMDADMAHSLNLEGQLIRALKEKQFQLHYQPQVDLDQGTVTGLEALIRWNHPERGLVTPQEFVPVLEEINLINDVGRWVIEQACRHIRAWSDLGLDVPPVSINVSAQQISTRRIVDEIADGLNRCALSPESLNIEVTETVVMQDLELSRRILHEIKNLGVGLQLDDFGTGYSSLNVLKNLPFDTLKIDAAFVANLGGNPRDANLARAILAMARSLKLATIAEGVETGEQRDFLSRFSCDVGQGYLFGRPSPPDQITELLGSRKAPDNPDESPKQGGSFHDLG